jgi:hypothetical protein
MGFDIIPGTCGRCSPVGSAEAGPPGESPPGAAGSGALGPAPTLSLDHRGTGQAGRGRIPPSPPAAAVRRTRS